LGVHHWGLPAFMLLSALATTLLAAAFWHLVERPALRLKHWTPFTRPLAPDTDQRPRTDTVTADAS
jgi:peptidoglycan/LPS O-acetylase OafA/YrhL